MSGLSRAALDEADACPERDDAHSGTGHDLLGDVEAESGGHGHNEVEQEQEPESTGVVESSDLRVFPVESGIGFSLSGYWGRRVSGLSRAGEELEARVEVNRGGPGNPLSDEGAGEEVPRQRREVPPGGVRGRARGPNARLS